MKKCVFSILFIIGFTSLLNAGGRITGNYRFVYVFNASREYSQLVFRDSIPFSNDYLFVEIDKEGTILSQKQEKLSGCSSVFLLPFDKDLFVDMGDCYFAMGNFNMNVRDANEMNYQYLNKFDKNWHLIWSKYYSANQPFASRELFLTKKKTILNISNDYSGAL